MRRAVPFVLAFPLAMCCPQLPREPEAGGYEMASAESQPVICADAEMTEKVRAILFKALDQSLESHIAHTFEVWMKDSRDQPMRARTGVTNGIVAYLSATKSAAAWSPMVCPG